MKRTAILIAALTLLLCCTAGATLAWLSAGDRAANAFLAPTVTSRVEEEFLGDVKRNVCVRNTGNIRAYVRAALVPIWRRADGTGSGETASLDQCQAVFGPEWFQAGDGFWYCKTPVEAGEASPVLLESLSAPKREGLRFELTVLCSALQSVPEQAVREAWPAVRVQEGALVLDTLNE